MLPIFLKYPVYLKWEQYFLNTLYRNGDVGYVIVTIVGYEHGDLISNPGRDILHCIWCYYPGESMDVIFLPPAMGKL